jgi:hypothetical protein
LRYVERNPSDLHRMCAIRRQAFDRRHSLTGRGRDRNAAGANGLTVDVQSTGAALGNAAGEFGACQSKLVADNPEQGSLRRDIDGMPSSIHCKVYCHSVPSLTDVFLSAYVRLIDGGA